VLTHFIFKRLYKVGTVIIITIVIINSTITTIILLATPLEPMETDTLLFPLGVCICLPWLPSGLLR